MFGHKFTECPMNFTKNIVPMATIQNLYEKINDGKIYLTNIEHHRRQKQLLNRL